MKISRWMVPGLVVIVALAIAAAASAAVSTVSSKRTIDPFDSVTVSCPKHTHSLGGGFQGPPGTLAQINRFQGAQKWKVEAFGLTPDPFRLRVLARCEPNRAGAVKRVSHSAVVAHETRGVVEATCPKGWRALAGGYADSPPFVDGSPLGQIAADTSERVGARTWRVAGFNQGDPSRLISSVVCGKGAVRGKLKTASAVANLTGSSTATAMCKRGWHTLGGGFSTPGEGKGVFPNIQRAAPLGSRGWSVTLPPGMIPAGLKMHSYAYCAKNRG